MKKILFISGTILCAGILGSGCASTGSRSEAAANYEKFKTERPEPVAVQSNNKALNDVASASAKVYGFTVKSLDEYISATDNSRQYRGFLNEMEDLMAVDSNLTKEQARTQALEAIRLSDEGKPEEEKVYQHVVDGYNAVQALKPSNKLKEVLALTIEAKKVADSAKNLSSSFKGFDMENMANAKSANNILNQATYTLDALGFLERQYSFNKVMEGYMQ